MKRYFYILGLVSLLIIAGKPVKAQWTSSTGLDGGYCVGIGMIDSTLYVTVGGNGVLFRNINTEIWNQCLSPKNFMDLVIPGEALFAWGVGMCYRSLDYGITWQSMDTILGGSMVKSMASAGTILFYTVSDTIFRSDDLGESHYPISNSLPYLDYPTVYVSNGMLFCSDFYPSLELYSSANFGFTWDSLTLKGLLPGTYSVSCMAYCDNRILLSTETGQYYFDTLTGSWIHYSDYLNLRRLSEINGTLYATSLEYGFLRFDATTLQWFPENTGLETLEAQGFCSLDSMLFLATDHGTYKCSNLYNWEPFYENMNGLTLKVPQSGDNKLWASTFHTYGPWFNNLYSSDDEGISFTRVDWNLTGEYKNGFFTDSCYYIIIRDSLYTSTDQGCTWVKKTQGLPYTSEWPYLQLRSLGINDHFVFLSTNYGLFRATYPNLQWQRLNSVYSNGRTYIDLLIKDSIIILEKEIYTNDYYYYTFRSCNNGETFDSLTVFSPDHGYSFVQDGEFFYAANDDSLFESDDYGITWESLTTPPYIHNMIISAGKGAIVMSGIFINYPDFYTVFLISYDHGNTWNDIWDNLSSLANPLWGISTSIYGQRLFASLPSQGIWYRDDLITDIKEKPSEPVQTLVITPNPSDGRFEIRLKSCEVGTYLLKIFSITGKMVYTKTIYCQTGNPIFEKIDLQNLPNGLYLVTLDSGNRNYSEKLMIR